VSELPGTQVVSRRCHPIRHRLEYLAVLAVRATVRMLPWSWNMRAGDAMGWLFYRLDRRRRATSFANVRAAFPLRSDNECRATAQGAFMNLGRHVLDLLRFDAMSVEQMMGFFEFEGEEHVEQARASGLGVMYCGGHFGFWELQILAHAVRHEPIIMVARTLDNPFIEAMIERLRTRVGTCVIPRQGAARALLRGLRSQRSVAMMIDQHLHARSAVIVEFFDRPAATTSAVASLALRTGVSVIPVFALPLPGGRYRMIYEAPVVLPDPQQPDAVAVLTQRCTDVLEIYVRRYPEHWLWMHRRWRVADTVDSSQLSSETARPSAGVLETGA
jgi:KDO2-lipid IV(A) lauroyltransferase